MVYKNNKNFWYPRLDLNQRPPHLNLYPTESHIESARQDFKCASLILMMLAVNRRAL